MSIGTAEQLVEMVKADAECKMDSQIHEFYYTSDIDGWEKKPALVGTGHCVPLVQEATGAPVTSLWVKGPKVKGNSKIPAGTAIATFDGDGRYANLPTGNHAAIFVSVDTNGIVVVDQWKSKTKPAAPSRRTLKFREGKGSASNDGDQFSVVVTQKIQNHPDKKV